jgi:murein DD-endopeptidase MepM/ murein hydrolase activator NlpD
MKDPTSRKKLVDLMRRLVASHAFILAVFLAVVTLNLWSGEPKLLAGLVSIPAGGPLIEESGLPSQNKELSSYDTASPTLQGLGLPDFGDPLIRFGDTLGGFSDPAGILLEWVPENVEILTHTVAEGETLSDIARAYGISVETILWSNGLTSSSAIKPGDVLKFPSVSGVLHVVRKGQTLSEIASLYGVSVERILAANHGVRAASIEEGDELIIPGGRPRVSRVSSREGRTIDFGSSLGYFISPTIGLNWGRLHYNNAVDIANACGTPVWAAAAGVVVEASYGWNGGYGNLIRISHPNGMQTYYAHLQTLLANVGAPVSQGEQIGTIGNTGRTHGPTGCHLHFEVRGGANPFARYR